MEKNQFDSTDYAGTDPENATGLGQLLRGLRLFLVLFYAYQPAAFAGSYYPGNKDAAPLTADAGSTALGNALGTYDGNYTGHCSACAGSTGAAAYCSAPGFEA